MSLKFFFFFGSLKSEFENVALVLMSTILFTTKECFKVHPSTRIAKQVFIQT